ncbi:MAG: hypothetical protein M2R45_02470 [Verrucomicrobia subdivision 3 bacterium]|nr:hypothetical protein [Limisphaerales bacterium]MCS1413258.1 hypothetical protein [Limisphaerales bacterium]
MGAFFQTWEISLSAPDIEFGLNGTIYVCGWDGDYHYQPGEKGTGSIESIIPAIP